MVLKMRFMELSTGFYTRSNGIVTLFNLALLAAVLILFLSNRLRRTTNDYPVHRSNPLTGILCAAVGVTAVLHTVLDSNYTILEQNQSESLLSIRNGVAVLLGILAGFSMIWLGIGILRDKLSQGAMIPAIFGCVWQAYMLVTRFNGFTVLTTISDNLLAVLFMVFATLFWVGHARTLYGLSRKDGRNYTIPAGLCASLFGFALVIPNYAYMLVHRTGMPAPMLGTFESVYTLALSVYALLFVIDMIRSIKLV